MKISKRKWELNWHNPKLTLKYVSLYKGRNKGTDKGYGVFAKSSIKKGEILTIFGGYVIPIHEIGKLPEKLQELCYQIHDNFFYGPVLQSEVSLNEHYNHSCQSNTGFKDSITLVAIRDIKTGEELFTDYALFITTNKFDFKCGCGLDTCRNFITGNDWKIKDLQKKYKGYFQPYINDKINNFKLK